MCIKRIGFVLYLMVLNIALLNAQSITLNPTDATALFQASSTSQGILVPKMTSTQRGLIQTPLTGLLVYQTDAPEGFYYFNSVSTWVLVGSGSNGLNTLSKTTVEPAGYNCVTGAIKLEFGLDTNSNGILDAQEIDASLTKYLCNGAAGTAGQGVPKGGSTGQVLAKINTTDYNNEWVTPNSSVSLQLFATNTVVQNQTTSWISGGTNKYQASFNNILSGSNTNAWTGNNTFTVSSGGLYQINIILVNQNSSGVPVTPVPQIEITSGGNTSKYYGVGIASSLLPAGTFARGNISTTLPLNTGDIVKIYWGFNVDAVQNSMSTDGSSNISIIKMN